MRHLLLTCFAGLLLLSGSALAQGRLYLEPRLGFGTFQMASMKELQQTIIQGNGSGSEVKPKAVDSFGPYLQYGLNLTLDLTEQTKVGVFLERGSTGGRVSYQDYSGELRFDTFVNYAALGFLVDTRKPIGNGPFNMVGGIELNGFFSKLRVESYTRIFEQSNDKKDVFNSFGVGVKPYIGLQRSLLQFPVQLTVGYLAGINGPFRVPGEPDSYVLRNKSGDKLEPDWNGFRVNLTVAFPIASFGL